MPRQMKDSGVAWIGNIPENWSVQKVKNAFYRSKEEAHIEDPVVLSLARSGVKVRDISNNEGQLAESYYNYNPVVPGDLLLNPMDLYSGANCSVSKVEGVISPAYINLRTRGEYCPTYYDYYFKTQYWAMALFAHGKGVSFDNRWTLSPNDLFNYHIPVPNFEEQKRIAEFLDCQCAEIDAVIAKTSATIEEYKKLKQSIITDAVTKGIRGNKKMKDSGVAWIGYICDEYNVWRMKFLLSEPLMYGANETGISYEETLPRYIRITDITGDGKLKDYGKLSLSEESATPYILKDNDVLFARSGGTVGKAFIYKKEYGKSAFAGYLIKASTNDNLLSDYLFYYTQSSLYEEWKNQIFIQATIQNIGADRYNNLPIVLPPIEEQNEIVAFLEKKCVEIDTLIEKKTALLVEMETYKKSVIYEYVTGKKEVL